MGIPKALISMFNSTTFDVFGIVIPTEHIVAIKMVLFFLRKIQLHWLFCELDIFIYCYL